MTKIYYKRKPRLVSSFARLLVVMVCLLAFGNAHAQVSTLDYSTSAQSYSALVISGGTLVSSSTSATDDDNNYAT